MVHRRNSVRAATVASDRRVDRTDTCHVFPMASSPEDFAAKMREEKGYGENVGVFVVGMG